MHKTIIFDIDGTLVNSNSSVRYSVDEVAFKHNLKRLNDKEFALFLTYSPIYSSFSNVYKLDDVEAKIYGDEFIKHNGTKGIYKSELYNNVIELLELLKEKQYKLGIATCKNQSNAQKIIKHLQIDKYFDIVCGLEQSQENKLTILDKCIRKLDSNRQNCLYIGDTENDANAAKDLGIDFIAVTYGYGFKTISNQKNLYNVKYANNIKDLIKIFNNT